MENAPTTSNLPKRGDQIDTWIKAFRDIYPNTSNEWDALDALLDDYRLRADYGYSLAHDLNK
jgi:hypothetical protein